MKKWLFNPFVYIAGARALFIGIAVMLVTAVICYYGKAHFDGVLHMAKEKDLNNFPVYAYFIDSFVDWGCLVLLFYIAGRIFSHSAIRFIDVAGTMALARWVMIFMAISGIFIVAPDTSKSVEELVKSITPLTIILSLAGVVLLVWLIILMYNAFTISCNLKGGKAIAIFVIVLLLADASSRFINYQLYKHLAQ